MIRPILTRQFIVLTFSIVAALVVMLECFPVLAFVKVEELTLLCGRPEQLVNLGLGYSRSTFSGL